MWWILTNLQMYDANKYVFQSAKAHTMPLTEQVLYFSPETWFKSCLGLNLHRVESSQGFEYNQCHLYKREPLLIKGESGLITVRSLIRALRTELC